MGTHKNPTPLGALIHQLMARTGLHRQIDLARQTGLSTSTISRLIYEPVEPEFQTLAVLAQFFKVDENDLRSAARGGDVDLPKFHPLGAELDRLLGQDSPLDDQEKADLERLVGHVMDPFRARVPQARNVI